MSNFHDMIEMVREIATNPEHLDVAISFVIIVFLLLYQCYKLHIYHTLQSTGDRVMGTITFVTTDIEHIDNSLDSHEMSPINIGTPPYTSYNQTYYKINYKFTDKEGNESILKLDKVPIEYGWAKKEGVVEEVTYMPDNRTICCPVDYIPIIMNYHFKLLMGGLGMLLFLMAYTYIKVN